MLGFNNIHIYLYNIKLGQSFLKMLFKATYKQTIELLNSRAAARIANIKKE